MDNSLIQLMGKYQRGNRPVFHTSPFLPLTHIREKKLSFNDIMKESGPMTQAALMSFEFGFENTVLPFDLNVEAEILGAGVRYHEGFDGHPVFPTIAEKPVSSVKDIHIPDDLEQSGRMPVLLESIRSIREQAHNKGAIGAFMTGPFTLAGQVMDMDKLYVMLLKQPELSRKIFEKLTKLILKLKEVYIRAGIDFIFIVEGGSAAISPKTFRELILPQMQRIFESKEVPHIAYISGNTNTFEEFISACDPDGIVLGAESSVETARGLLLKSIPLFSPCGSYDMMATATRAKVIETVNRHLDKGFITAGPPADIYPPAKIENIKAFVEAVQVYKA